MRASFFQKTIEYSLEIDGETWQQGDKVSGQLVLKNHDTNELNLKDYGVYLTYAQNKKVQSKDPKSFKVIDNISFTELNTINANDGATLPFSFKLSSDCPITEKSSSLYINCGNKESLHEGGQLQINIAPTKAVNDFIQIFTDFHRLKLKSLKTKKEYIEVIMDVPAIKDYSNITKFTFLIRLTEENLEVKYQIKTKKLDYTDSLTKAKDILVEFEQVLTKKDYSIYGNAVNQSRISEFITNALDKIKLKPFF
jgi:sporulation-control protein spo0M